MFDCLPISLLLKLFCPVFKREKSSLFKLGLGLKSTDILLLCCSWYLSEIQISLGNLDGGSWQVGGPGPASPKISAGMARAIQWPKSFCQNCANDQSVARRYYLPVIRVSRIPRALARPTEASACTDGVAGASKAAGGSKAAGASPARHP